METEAVLKEVSNLYANLMVQARANQHSVVEDRIALLSQLSWKYRWKHRLKRIFGWKPDTVSGYERRLAQMAAKEIISLRHRVVELEAEIAKLTEY